MELSQIAQSTGLQQNAIKFLLKQNIIKKDVSIDDLFFMCTLSLIWGNAEFIKMQVSRYNMAERARIVLTAGLSNIEGRLFSRWLLHYCDREEYKVTLHIEQVVDEIMHYLNLPSVMRNSVKKTAKNMRTKARNYYYRYERAELVEIAKALTLQKKSRKPARKTNMAISGKSPSEKERQGFKNIFGDGPIDLSPK